MRLLGPRSRRRRPAPALDPATASSAVHGLRIRLQPVRACARLARGHATGSDRRPAALHAGRATVYETAARFSEAAAAAARACAAQRRACETAAAGSPCPPSGASRTARPSRAAPSFSARGPARGRHVAHSMRRRPCCPGRRTTQTRVGTTYNAAPLSGTSRPVARAKRGCIVHPTSTAADTSGPGAAVARGEPSPGADVARASPVPAQMRRG